MGEKMEIIEVKQEDLERCVEVIFETEMGRKYYPTKAALYSEVEKGMLRDKFYAAKNYNGEIIGVLWYQQEGMFHSFPYLHIIAVKRNYQHQGIGKKLLDFFEREALANGKNHLRTKVFLTVGDFNENAVKIYKARGYIKLCEIEGLFRKNIVENIFMKIVIDKSCNK